MRHKLFISTIMLFVCLLSFAADKRVKVACIGNSVTYGYGHAAPAETSYPTQLNRLLGESYEVGNFGKSGATLLRKGHRPYDKQKEYSDALAFVPDIAIIHLGLNDTDPRNWPNYRDEFIPDYLALIDTLRQTNPKVKIWLCRMTPIFNRHPRFKSGTRDWHAQIQEAIEETAKIAGTGIIDLHAPLYNRPDLFADALHPNAEGAGIIARTVYGAITGDYGGLSLPSIYSDNMVVQRDRPFTLSGTADAGEKVVARLGKEKKSTKADCDGRWKITFAPLATGRAYSLEVKSGDREIKLNNIVAGEVWLCSGQSNMAFMLKEGIDAKKYIADAGNHNIRIYNMKPRVITNPISWEAADLEKLNRHDYYLPTQWEQLTAENGADFSAVAYHFGAMLADSLKVPVGLICNAVGGATTEAFVDRRTLEFHPHLVDILYNWRQNDMVQDWVRQRSTQNIANSKNPLQRHPYEPCYLFESGIAPLSCYAVRGAIWYQGESNAHNMEIYEELFAAMLQSWRNVWGEEMPFYFVQLSSLNRPSWTHFRDAQRRLALATKNCAMAVSSDHGDRYDVHPREKSPIGRRLARLALNGTYGYSHVTPCGPQLKSATAEGSTLCVSFDNADGLCTADGKELRTFEIAEESGVFHPATATIDGTRILLKAKGVKKPVRVRYGWQPYTEANLINSDSLPASTFQTIINL
ncbi:MAG: sialate O-acetylesterase [Bacteroidaceae bacterium]|nr:sialate O-acetylesterase [Bacteroidaceae bacterium]